MSSESTGPRPELEARAGSTAPDLKLDVFSAFAVVDLKPGKWTLIGRVDRFNDPNPDGGRIDYLPLATNARDRPDRAVAS